MRTRTKFGPKSEKLDPTQMELALEDLERMPRDRRNVGCFRLCRSKRHTIDGRSVRTGIGRQQGFAAADRPALMLTDNDNCLPSQRMEWIVTTTSTPGFPAL
ncbi:transposase [Mesorhizobium sp.]|uniref:transposase n=1 Tax=Mesorhizobium sp. TaxID=1871066 RepID=UPI0025F25CC4|nr:transposase [Mesorhizobium sp.]